MSEAPLEATLPVDPSTPVVVSVPHAGVETAGYDAPLAPGLDPHCDADLFVDELYGPAVRGAFIRARLSRFVCDLNRDPSDDSARGFVWQVTTTGSPALSRPLSDEEWQSRRVFHERYHSALATALGRARDKFGFALLVDGHSMPSVGRQGHTDPGRPRADFVPGDRDGRSCSPALSRLVGAYLEARGFSVAFNDPYRGGYITSHHGRPADGVHAIQIEMRRDLYMDEASFTRLPAKMAAVTATIADLLRALDRFTP